MVVNYAALFTEDRNHDNKTRMGREAMKPMIEIKPRIAGLHAAAKACGCTAVHLRYVLKGERNPSARLSRKLRAIGVTARLDGTPFRGRV